MNSKVVGITVIIIGLLLGVLLIQLTGGLYHEADILGCYQNRECVQIDNQVSAAHFAFGILGFFLALGLYMILFAKTDQALLRRIEGHEEKITKEEKWNLLLKGLDEDEKAVMNILKSEEGITQNTLRLKTDMSKAKLSAVLSGLEKKELIKRNKKGKTLAIFLR